MNKQISKFVLIFAILIFSGCAEKVNEITTSKEPQITQNTQSAIKEKPRESPSPLPERYVSCGYCGCCGQSTPIKRCLYRSKGDDLQKIIDEDKKPRDCSKVGCAGGIEYRYCD